MTKLQFIERMKKACVTARQKGARVNVPVCMAQAALESNWGNSGLCTRANNLFGIKASASWRGPTLDLPTREWSKEKGWYSTTARWRKYPSWNECIVDYSQLIHSLSWYQGCTTAIDNAEAYLQALLPAPGKPGWATDPDYARKVRNVALEIERLGGPAWG